MKFDLAQLGIVLAILSLIAGISVSIIVWWRKSKHHRIITILLLLFLLHNIYIAFKIPSQNSLSSTLLLSIPLVLFIIYFVYINVTKQEEPPPTNIENHYNSIDPKINDLLDKLLENIEAHGFESIPTLQILAKTFSNSVGKIEINAADIVQVLIIKVKAWMSLDNIGDREELDHLIGATLTTIANITITNDLKDGEEFLFKEIYNLLHQHDRYSQAPIIMTSLETSKEILKKKSPNYNLYGTSV